MDMMAIDNNAGGRPSSGYEEKISLMSILTCIICSAKARSAHLCPNCSKFFCQNCIRGWMRVKNRYCPGCLHPIEETTIVNCNKLSQDLSQALETLMQVEAEQPSAHKQENCYQHSLQLSYYCKDCCGSLCSDCIILSEKHKGHRFMKIKQIKIRFREKTLQVMTKLRHYKREVLKNKQVVSIGHMRQNELLQSRILQLKHHLDNKVKSIYEQTTNGIEQDYQQKIGHLQTNIAACNKTYQSLKQELANASKAHLVAKSYKQMEQMIQKAMRTLEQTQVEHGKDEQADGHQEGIKYSISRTHQTDSLEVIRKQIQKQLNSKVIPKWNQKVFILNNYAYFRQRNEIVYSDVFYDGRLEWRLKIYTNGVDNSSERGDHAVKDSRIKQQLDNHKNVINREENKQVAKTNMTMINKDVSVKRPISESSHSQLLKQQPFISIYVQLSSGVRNNSLYMHKVDIIHQNDATKVISQTYQSNFEIGECWGYDNFAKISTLYQQGYVDPKDDSLKIRLSVKSPSYFHCCVDQNAVIFKKQSTKAKCMQTISKLKGKIGDYVERRQEQDNKYNAITPHPDIIHNESQHSLHGNGEQVETNPHEFRKSKSHTDKELQQGNDRPAQLQQNCQDHELATCNVGNHEITHTINTINQNFDNHQIIHEQGTHEITHSLENHQITHELAIHKTNQSIGNQETAQNIGTQEILQSQQDIPEPRLDDDEIDFQEYSIDDSSPMLNAYASGSQQMDYQSNELKKVYKRLKRCHHKNVLMF